MLHGGKDHRKASSTETRFYFGNSTWYLAHFLFRNSQRRCPIRQAQQQEYWADEEVGTNLWQHLEPCCILCLSLITFMECVSFIHATSVWKSSPVKWGTVLSFLYHSLSACCCDYTEAVTQAMFFTWKSLTMLNRPISCRVKWPGGESGRQLLAAIVLGDWPLSQWWRGWLDSREIQSSAESVALFQGSVWEREDVEKLKKIQKQMHELVFRSFIVFITAEW